MKIPLNQFESYITESTLKKGLSYFNKGKVTELEIIEPGLIQATVSGTERYTVTLYITNEILTESSCTCPFDHHEICKHTCAVLFHLQQEYLDLPKPKAAKHKASNNSENEQNSVKSRSGNKQIEEMIDNIPTDELRSYIKKLALNRKFKEQFLLDFSHYNKNEKIDSYIRKVKKIISESSTSYRGPYSYSGKYVFMECELLFEKTREHLNNANFKTAFFINGAIIKILNSRYDDFIGDIHYIDTVIEIAFKFIDEIIKSNKNEKLKNEIFKFFLEQIEDDSSVFSTWNGQIIDLCIELASSKSDLNQIEELLNFLSSDNVDEENTENDLDDEFEDDIIYDFIDVFEDVFDDEFDDEDEIDYSQYIFKVILKRDGKEQAYQYAYNNIDKISIRFLLIDSLLSEEKFKDAEKLVDEGLKQYKDYNNQLYYFEMSKVKLSLAMAKNDTPVVMKIASELLRDNFNDEFDYYFILKKFCTPEEWPALFKKITSLGSKNALGLNTDQIASIYQREEKWDELMSFITKLKSIGLLDTYYSDLMPTHGHEVIALYAEIISLKAKSCSRREHYQEIAGLLSHLKFIGGQEQVTHLQQEFLKLYKHKPAFVQELKKL